LIVTPPSLLKQWISEIHTHAPGIRVCVYEGWQSLRSGLTKYTNASQRERQKKMDIKRKRVNDKLRKETMQKYQKSVTGTRVKNEPGVDHKSDGETDSDDESEESVVDITQRLFVDYVRGHDVVITTYG
jgi:E3 ubiquitin-protein ligase SHPRH